jgi:excinuclease UvrABC ATPase subunit
MIKIEYSNNFHFNLKKSLYILKNKKEKNMNESIHCPNQGCRGGKVHYLVGFDILWDDCPICRGSGSVKRRVPDKVIEYQR